jgi:phosphomannomutase/phosphoglucomutase
VTEDVQLARPLRLVVDCGNGVAGPVVLRLLRELGCEVIELFCEVDGSFPNHHPDPSQPGNLLPLIMEMGAQEADLGLAFDGDGDRLGVVDSSGKIIWPDRLLMLLVEQVLAMNPGADILFDVKSSHHLADQIRSLSGRPVLCPTGHSLLKAKARETGAPLAGELSGHILFQDRWNGFDDAFYAAARVLEVLALDPRPSAQVFADLPDSPATPELLLELDEGEPQAMMERLSGEARFDGAQINRLDGLRVEFPDGWGLVRASNTTPALSFRFEADNESRLEEVKELFRIEILTLYPGLKLPF